MCSLPSEEINVYVLNPEARKMTFENCPCNVAGLNSQYKRVLTITHFHHNMLFVQTNIDLRVLQPTINHPSASHTSMFSWLQVSKLLHFLIILGSLKMQF